MALFKREAYFKTILIGREESLPDLQLSYCSHFPPPSLDKSYIISWSLLDQRIVVNRKEENVKGHWELWKSSWCLDIWRACFELKMTKINRRLKINTPEENSISPLQSILPYIYIAVQMFLLPLLSLFKKPPPAYALLSGHLTIARLVIIDK